GGRNARWIFGGGGGAFLVTFSLTGGFGFGLTPGGKGSTSFDSSAPVDFFGLVAGMPSSRLPFFAFFESTTPSCRRLPGLAQATPSCKCLGWCWRRYDSSMNSSWVLRTGQVYVQPPAAFCPATRRRPRVWMSLRSRLLPRRSRNRIASEIW